MSMGCMRSLNAKFISVLADFFQPITCSSMQDLPFSAWYSTFSRLFYNFNLNFHFPSFFLSAVEIFTHDRPQKVNLSKNKLVLDIITYSKRQLSNRSNCLGTSNNSCLLTKPFEDTVMPSHKVKFAKFNKIY